MLVKVFIKRRFKKEKARAVFSHLKKLRFEAMQQKGYITGETLIDPDDPQKLMVIATWESRKDWLNWKMNENRKAKEAELEVWLEAPAEYETYVYSKYWISVHTSLAEGVEAEYL
jgi:heme-degrading monooxygenase HmoA